MGVHATEEDAYASLGVPWIPPELRQGEEEIVRAAAIASLVTMGDVKGELHARTTWSDGTGSVADMTAAVGTLGYDFLGISDHSQGLGIAHGLDRQRLAAQRAELEAIGQRGPVRLCAGAEVEVATDGRRDFDDAVLARLDVVVASPHSGLRRPHDVPTERLLRVPRNPHVDVIAQPSGRLIERREGGDFDWGDRVFAAAAETGTALEINADPSRLDLNAPLARRALAAGCLLSIDADAHSADGLGRLEYRIAVARRAWTRPRQIMNCRSLPEV